MADPITTLPPAPSRQDPDNFPDEADDFLGALDQFVTETNAVAVAMNLNDTNDVSSSSVLIGLGAKTFTVTAAKSFLPGMYLVIADDAAPSINSMVGQVTSYSGTTLVMNITALTGSGTKSAWTISQSVPYLSLDDRLQQNLLTNSGFEVWSNSTLAQGYSTGDYSDDLTSGFTSSNNQVTGDQTEESTWAGASGTTQPTGWEKYNTPTDYTVDGDGLRITTDGSNEGIYRSLSGLTTEGHLYKLSFTYKNTAGDIAGYAIYDATNGEWVQENTDLSSNTSNTTFSKIVTAPKNCITLRVYLYGKNSGDIVWFNNLALYEVTPGCVAANALACDGWYKYAGTYSCLREPNGSNTKEGSYYALKSVPTAQYDGLRWPLAAIGVRPEFVAGFAGQTVSAGKWIKSSTADDIRISIRDGVGVSSSDYHTGGGAYEWLEVTRTVDASASEFYIYIEHRNASPGTAYISQPMLVFGSSIGEGNYSRPSGEVINIEAPFYLTDYAVTAKSSAADVPVDLQAQSNGKLPAGLKAINVVTFARDSASSSAVAVFGLGADVSVWQELRLNIGNSGLTLGNDDIHYMSSRIVCNSDGNIEAEMVASGSLTLDVGVTPLAVELR